VIKEYRRKFSAKRCEFSGRGIHAFGEYGGCPSIAQLFQRKGTFAPTPTAQEEGIEFIGKSKLII